MKELIAARIAEIEKKIAGRTDRTGKPMSGYGENVTTCRTMIEDYKALLKRAEENNNV